MAGSGKKSKSPEKSGFVDRDYELEKLNEIKEDVKDGNGRFALLEGEAGVGKSRLAEEFCDDCEKDGFKVLKGRCFYHETPDPFIPFLEALEDYIDTEDEEDTSSSSSTPYGRGIGSDVPSSGGKSAMSLIGMDTRKEEISTNISLSDQREMMFDKITTLVKDLSKNQPVTLFFDDLQWIDESSSQLLHHLTRNIPDSRVLILGAYRPEELRGRHEELPLESVLDRMKEEKLVEIIEVGRLGFRAVSKLVKKQLKAEDLPQSFLLMINRETEGNPYYMMEMLNSLVDEGVIDPYSYTWDPEKELTDISIPTSIKDITSRRIDRLDREEKKVLMYASVIGTDFNFEILENAIDMDVIELLDVVDELQDHGLIHEKESTEEETYRFNHLQTRMTIYDDMGKSRKRVLHGIIGETIEDLYKGDLEEQYYTLSRHFYRGKQFDKAYEYSTKSAENAIQTFAIEDAIRLYKRAIESLDKASGIEDKDEKKIELLEKVGNLYYDISRWEETKDIWNRLMDLAEERENEELKAKALRKLGHVNREVQEYDKAREQYNDAFWIYERLGDDKGLADCKRGLGYILWREGKLDEGVEQYKIAIEKAKASGADRILALTYVDWGNIYAHKGENDKAIEQYKQSLEPLKKQNAYRELAKAYNNIGDQYMKKGDYDKAIDYFEKTIDNAKKIGNKMFIGWGSFNTAEALAKKGDTEKAATYLERAEKVMEEIGDNLGLSAVYANRGIIKREKGEYEGAIESFERGIEIVKDLEIPFEEGEYNYELGKVYQQMGDKEEAKRCFEKAKEKLDIVGSEKFKQRIDDELKELEKE